MGRMSGEFAEMGFLVSVQLRDGLFQQGFNAFLDRWIEVIERRDLCFGGGGSHDTGIEGFVAQRRRGSATEHDREALREYLSNDSAVATFEIGPLEV